jgi:hypothetical protein
MKNKLLQFDQWFAEVIAKANQKAVMIAIIITIFLGLYLGLLLGVVINIWLGVAIGDIFYTFALYAALKADEAQKKLKSQNK